MSSFLVGVLVGAGGLATLSLIAFLLLVWWAGNDQDLFERMGEGQPWQD